MYAYQLYVFYGLVAFTFTACVVQGFNLREALRDLCAAQQVFPPDPARLVTTRERVRAQALMLATHIGMFIAFGWVVLSRFSWFKPSPHLSFFMFVGGVFLTPSLLLVTSWSLHYMRKQLDQLENQTAKGEADHGT